MPLIQCTNLVICFTIAYISMVISQVAAQLRPENGCKDIINEIDCLKYSGCKVGCKYSFNIVANHLPNKM